jgi:cytochrome c oxidase subunit IV
MSRLSLFVWLGLLLLFGLELGLTLAGYGVIAPLIGFGMAVTIVFGFMRLGRAPSLSRFFAGAAAFWLLVLFGLGSVDFVTRIDVPVATNSTH